MRRSATVLWFAVLAAPAAWAFQLVVGSEIEELACAPNSSAGTEAAVAAVGALALAVAFAGLVAATRVLREVGGGRWADAERAAGVESGPEVRRERTRFVANVAVLTSSVLLAAICLGIVQLFVLEGCAR